MAKILFLAHRVPFPPNKGDKIRAFHILKHLAQSHEIYLGTLADEADDFAVADWLEASCADVCIARRGARVVRLENGPGLSHRGADERGRVPQSNLVGLVRKAPSTAPSRI